MKNKHIIELLPAYLDDSLSIQQKKQVEDHILICKRCSKELDELKSFLKVFDEETEIAPSENLKEAFYAQIEFEKKHVAKDNFLTSISMQRNTKWLPNLLKIAASIVVLISVFFVGKLQQKKSSNQEIVALTNETYTFKQTAMLSLMGNKSASKRIEGVHFIEKFKEPDKAIVHALADRMLHDENTNVRRTAVEVLGEFAASEMVKNNFIAALKTEKDPGIQITLIHILGEAQAKKAATSMQYLLEQDDTQPYVKDELEAVLPNII